MGSVMGKMDPNATNDIDAAGNIVATGTPGAKTVADPSQGLTAGQMFTRKAIAGSLAGAGQGLQQQAGMRPAPVDFSRFGAKPGVNPVQGPVINPAQPVVPPQSTGTVPPNNNPQNGMSAGMNGNNNPFPRGPRPSLFYGAPGGY